MIEGTIVATTGRRPTTEWTPDPVQPWMDDALCAQSDPEMFFPEKGASTRDAKSVCASCEVVEQCLEFALARNVQWGVWGGLSAVERRGRVDTEERRQGVMEGLRERIPGLKAMGMSDVQIAASFGCAPTTVAAVRRSLGIAGLSAGRKAS